jgi:hypothetical protein
MRRLLVALVLVVPLVTAADASAFRHTTERAPWTVIDVSKHGRALRVSYIGGGCAGAAKAHVTETRDAVGIRLDQAVAVPENDHEGCTADLVYYSLVVRLKDPIDGRRLRGQARGTKAAGLTLGLFRLDSQERIIWLVPGVVGLAPSDARRLLRLQGYRRFAIRRAAGCAQRAQVAAQWPHAHTVRSSARIGLVVRRACG